MQHLLFSTDNGVIGLILRLTLGFIMLLHGAQKMFGLFGGYGFNGTMDFFTKNMHLPWIIGFMVIIIEFFGAVFLIFGFCTRLWASLFIIIMIGAIITTNFSNGFFMNWFGNQSGEGYEYHLLVIGICIALTITGSGKFGIDSFLSAK